MQPALAQTALGRPTTSGILFFFAIVAVTLIITYWAAKRTTTTKEFYVAGRSVSAIQNGLALAGTYMSAASFLGIAGLTALNGYDGMIYCTGWLVGWPALMFLIAEPLRNLGKYTFADVLAYRLHHGSVRIAAAIGGIITVLTHTIANMVGAGSLIKLMFGIPYEIAEISVGMAMLAYVFFGGMVATTWVQIVKACLLLGGVTILTIPLLATFNFNLGDLYTEVSKMYGQIALEPGGLVKDPIEAISLGIALMFGLLGLPHILMRFYTVPDARTARLSMLYATGFIGYFYCIIPIVGFGASVLVGRNIIANVDKGGNMAPLLLGELLGGTPFLGFIAAVAFATILAVVAGLTLAGASTFSHDIYVNVLKKGQVTEKNQVRIAKIATAIFSICAVLLGILFKHQNVAYMVGLTFSIACSANFPPLLMSILWKRYSSQAAVWSIIIGTTVSVSMIIMSPTVWVDIFNNPKPIITLRNPAIISMPLSFLFGWLISLISPDSKDENKENTMIIRKYLGIGAE